MLQESLATVVTHSALNLKIVGSNPAPRQNGGTSKSKILLPKMPKTDTLIIFTLASLGDRITHRTDSVCYRAVLFLLIGHFT